ncbi:hypothetical protein AXF42_Ash013675 [Apostasia shenzhenica]|uniref:Uncharacterized protein n=1 Tax=Apostasia shenzhenica TaxID=1088818 RepID=A0A2I0APK4_9ASPA|nr:hypothetical protein AXF42_Ash013675 [Apostasia shenzhenica]
MLNIVTDGTCRKHWISSIAPLQFESGFTVGRRTPQRGPRRCRAREEELEPEG